MKTHVSTTVNGDAVEFLCTPSETLLHVLRNVDRATEDLACQCGGLLANLSENAENQISLVEEHGVPALVTLARAENDEVQQDCARALS